MQVRLEECIQEYIRKGWQVVPVPKNEKGPRIPKWQELRIPPENLAAYFPPGKDQNVGVILGEPSGWLVDVDLDCPEAVALADEVLPDTEHIFGRKSKPRSHWLYACPGLEQTIRLKDLDGATLVELRSNGAQTIFPPSVHPSGEVIAWDYPTAMVKGVTTVKAPQLLRNVKQLAAFALIARHWPEEGSRHDAALALAGGLARSGFYTELCARIVGKIAEAAGDEESYTDRIRSAAYTAKKLAKENGRVTGWPTLARIIGRDVVDRALEWLGVDGRDFPDGDAEGGGNPPQRSSASIDPQLSLLLTDRGNARAFADHFHKDIRYNFDTNQWLVWDGTRFRPDGDGEIQRRLMSFVDVLGQNLQETAAAMTANADEKTRARALDSVARWVRQSACEPNLSRMEQLARNIRPIASVSADYDQNQYLLNVLNGTLDLRTGVLRAHDRGDMLTKRVPWPYEPRATAPRWEKFLLEVFEGNNEVIEAVQRYVGYSLTGVTHEQVFFFLHGTGSNGKSTLLTTLRNMLGPDYAIWTPFSTFESGSATSGHSDALMALEGKRLIVSTEKRELGTLSEDVLKILAGEESVTGSRKYERTRTFKQVGKVWLAANNLPRVSDLSRGFWRRVILIPFNRDFEKEGTREKGLDEKLLEEMPGILAWAVRGCLAWQTHGLPVLDAFKAARDDWYEESDPLAEFLSECQHEPQLETPVATLFASYNSWCISRGVKQTVTTPNAFSRLLRAHGYKKVHTRAGKKFVGIAPPV